VLLHQALNDLLNLLMLLVVLNDPQNPHNLLQVVRLKATKREASPPKERPRTSLRASPPARPMASPRTSLRARARTKARAKTD